VCVYIGVCVGVFFFDPDPWIVCRDVYSRRAWFHRCSRSLREPCLTSEDLKSSEDGPSTGNFARRVLIEERSEAERFSS